MNPDRQLKVSILGVAVTAVCCFTPVLVVLFALLGLSAVVGYLDYVLFPAMAAFAGLGIAAYRKRRLQCSTSKA